MIEPVLRNPIVLVHGLLGYDRICIAGVTVSEYFRGIAARLAALGNPVLVPRLSPTRGIAERAGQLRTIIELVSPAEPVHLFAHSLGGLDARFMITHLGMAERVLSLTTIGTPHRGSPFADWVLRRMEWWARPWLRMAGISYAAISDLTTERCRAFDSATPNVPGVRYFSVAGHCTSFLLRPLWWVSHGIVQRAEGSNDGVVSLQSAAFGEDLQIWEGDHLNLINIPNPVDQVRGRWKCQIERYLDLVRRLASAGY